MKQKYLKIMLVAVVLLCGSVNALQAQGDYFRRGHHARKVRMQELLTVSIDPMQIDDDSSAVLKKELQLYANDCFKKKKNRFALGTTMICLGSASLVGYAIYWPVGLAGTAVLASGIAVVTTADKFKAQGEALEARARSLIVCNSFEPLQLAVGSVRMDVGLAVMQDCQELSSTLGPSISLRF